MKKLKPWLGVSVLFCMNALAAGSADYCSKPIRLAMFEYGVLYRNSKGDGVDPRLLDILAKRSGCRFEKVLMPRARIWVELQGGTLDMATAAIPTPERKALGYLLPYMVTRNQVLVRKGSAPTPNDMDAFERSNLSMAAVRGFRHEPAYDAMLSRLVVQGRVKEVPDTADLLRYLDRGMVDAVLSQPIVFREYLAAETLKNDIAIRDWAPKDQASVGAFILSRKSFTAEQARRWDRLIVSMLEDGSILKIYREFLPQREAKEMMYTGPRDPE